MSIAVLGSGPSGAAVAWYLVHQGHEVELIDLGFDRDPELENAISKVQQGKSLDELKSIIDQRRQAKLDKKNPFPPKLPFGSDFVYQTPDLFSFETSKNITVVNSFAVGGLSNSWGANVSGIRQNDMNNWPITEMDLRPYYNMLSKIVGVSAAADNVDKLYAYPIGNNTHYPLGIQGRQFLQDTASSVGALNQKGIYLGRAKIAVSSVTSTLKEICNSCGMCMHGCPYEAIYNSRSTIKSLLLHPNFKYRSGYFIDSYNEQAQEVEMSLTSLSTKEKETQKYSRVFVALGAVGSTALYAKSTQSFDQVFKIKDSQKYYFPFLNFKRAKGSMEERANTLAQIFIQIVNLKSTSKTLHCQLYGLNDLLFEALKNQYGILFNMSRPLLRQFFERLMIGMVYFHSDNSGFMSLRLSKDNKISLDGEGDPNSENVRKEFFKRLRQNAGILGGIPLEFLRKKGPVGRSQHFGASLPMSINPKGHETDKLGRPLGHSRVHFVDSTVFTDIPGTPTTYSVMANALRIADASLKL